MKWLDELLPLEQALDRILKHVLPVDRQENVTPDKAINRVLAEDLTAMLNVPPFNRASMDGYAVLSGETTGAGRLKPVRLTLAGSIYAGMAPLFSVHAGECVYVATGAAIPAGADAVVRIEDCRREEADIDVYAPVKPGDNIAPAGEDIRCGSTVLEQGALLNPARMGVIASQGINEVKVYAKPEVAIVTTGEELAQPGALLQPGQIYDVNAATLSALSVRSGATAKAFLSVNDCLEDLEESLFEALRSDIVVVSGGSSVGERDHMYELLSSTGKVWFHGINIKPGKPTLFATIKGKPVLALPGYPTSCLINAYLLLKPALEKLARLPRLKARTENAKISCDISASKRRQFVPVRVDDHEAVPIGKESGAITATAYASGYVIIMENSALSRGSNVEVVLF
ncbi:MAG: molybdopterin molybdotransferase MoeA [Dehalococcoidaceae bacterium]|nr:molybdopterin molybdotransferase MoeA [Dehalococcoidaceae bacterium]